MERDVEFVKLKKLIAFEEIVQSEVVAKGQEIFHEVVKVNKNAAEKGEKHNRYEMPDPRSSIKKPPGQKTNEKA